MMVNNVQMEPAVVPKPSEVGKVSEVGLESTGLILLETSWHGYYLQSTEQ